MIGWAMAGEQFFNVKFLEEELGVCVEAARGKTCEVSSETIRSKIEMVMDGEGEKGIEIRRKASEVKEMMRKAMCDSDAGGKGSSLKSLDEFFMAAKKSMTATAERSSDEPVVG
ncbi:unnamed protein product [Linum tenue]|nr:unnamed protein product [Linum tenue]